MSGGKKIIKGTCKKKKKIVKIEKQKLKEGKKRIRINTDQQSKQTPTFQLMILSSSLWRMLLSVIAMWCATPYVSIHT